MSLPLAFLPMLLGAASLAQGFPVRASSPPLVVAAEGVLCDLTRTLAADQARVTCLIPAGGDPQAVRESGTRQLFAESLPISKTLRRISRASGVPVNPTPLVADGLAPDRSTVQTATGNVCTVVSGQGGRCDGAAAAGLARRWASIR